MKKMIIIIALAGAGCIEETTRDVVDKPIETVEIEQVVDTIVQDTVQVKTIWEQFVDAVIFVESIDNDSAYNHREKAVGCLQIRPIMVREVNRVLKKGKINLRYTMDDRWSREKSIEMFEIMAEQVECCEGLEFMEFFEIVARKWNGGGRGHKKKSTLVYWNKVKNKLGNVQPID